MLPNAYYWIEDERGAFLRYNYATVAYVVSDGLTVIQTDRCSGRHQAGSFAQGRRYLERWAGKGNGHPRRKTVTLKPLPDVSVYRKGAALEPSAVPVFCWHRS